MPVDPPSSAALDGVSRQYGLAPAPEDVESFASAVTGLLSSWDAVERLYAENAPSAPDRTWTGPADAEILARALEMVGNTAPFDVSGHPACSVPAGLAAGLPIGMMIIGKHFDDATVLRVAHAFEQAVGGFPAPRAATVRSSA